MNQKGSHKLREKQLSQNDGNTITNRLTDQRDKSSVEISGRRTKSSSVKGVARIFALSLPFSPKHLHKKESCSLLPSSSKNSRNSGHYNENCCNSNSNNKIKEDSLNIQTHAVQHNDVNKDDIEDVFLKDIQSFNICEDEIKVESSTNGKQKELKLEQKSKQNKIYKYSRKNISNKLNQSKPENANSDLKPVKKLSTATKSSASFENISKQQERYIHTEPKCQKQWKSNIGHIDESLNYLKEEKDSNKPVETTCNENIVTDMYDVNKLNITKRVPQKLKSKAHDMKLEESCYFTSGARDSNATVGSISDDNDDWNTDHYNLKQNSIEQANINYNELSRNEFSHQYLDDEIVSCSSFQVNMSNKVNKQLIKTISDLNEKPDGCKGLEKMVNKKGTFNIKQDKFSQEKGQIVESRKDFKHTNASNINAPSVNTNMIYEEGLIEQSVSICYLNDNSNGINSDIIKSSSCEQVVKMSEEHSFQSKVKSINCSIVSGNAKIFEKENIDSIYNFDECNTEDSDHDSIYSSARGEISTTESNSVSTSPFVSPTPSSRRSNSSSPESEIVVQSCHSQEDEVSGYYKGEAMRPLWSLSEHKLPNGNQHKQFLQSDIHYAINPVQNMQMPKTVDRPLPSHMKQFQLYPRGLPNRMPLNRPRPKVTSRGQGRSSVTRNSFNDADNRVFPGHLGYEKRGIKRLLSPRQVAASQDTLPTSHKSASEIEDCRNTKCTPTKGKLEDSNQELYMPPTPVNEVSESGLFLVSSMEDVPDTNNNAKQNQFKKDLKSLSQQLPETEMKSQIYNYRASTSCEISPGWYSPSPQNTKTDETEKYFFAPECVTDSSTCRKLDDEFIKESNFIEEPNTQQEDLHKNQCSMYERRQDAPLYGHHSSSFNEYMEQYALYNSFMYYPYIYKDGVSTWNKWNPNSIALLSEMHNANYEPNRKVCEEGVTVDTMIPGQLQFQGSQARDNKVYDVEESQIKNLDNDSFRSVRSVCPNSKSGKHEISRSSVLEPNTQSLSIDQFSNEIEKLDQNRNEVETGLKSVIYDDGRDKVNKGIKYSSMLPGDANRPALRQSGLSSIASNYDDNSQESLDANDIPVYNYNHGKNINPTVMTHVRKKDEIRIRHDNWESHYESEEEIQENRNSSLNENIHAARMKSLMRKKQLSKTTDSENSNYSYDQETNRSNYKNVHTPTTRFIANEKVLSTHEKDIFQSPVHSLDIGPSHSYGLEKGILSDAQLSYAAIAMKGTEFENNSQSNIHKPKFQNAHSSEMSISFNWKRKQRVQLKGKSDPFEGDIESESSDSAVGEYYPHNRGVQSESNISKAKQRIQMRSIGSYNSSKDSPAGSSNGKTPPEIAFWKQGYGGSYNTSDDAKNSSTPDAGDKSILQPKILNMRSQSAPTNFRPRFSNYNRMRGQSGADDKLSMVHWRNWKDKFRGNYDGVKSTFIDTHCHIDFLFDRSNFQGSYKEYMDEHSDTYLPIYEGCVAIFCNPRTFSPENSLWKNLVEQEGVYTAVGCHPKSATDFSVKFEYGMKQMLKHRNVVAVGEIGLDYSGSFHQHSEIQKMVLAKQCKIAMETKLPIIIHSRDSEHDIVEELSKIVPKNYKIHRHCFTGSWEEADAWLKKFPSSFIGLTPLITWYNNDRAQGPREVARKMPLEKLLLETDAPYFLPRGIPRDEEFSHPGYAVTVANEVARLKGLPLDEVLHACRRNTKSKHFDISR